MPRGYWMVQVDVSDPGAYQAYVAANAAAFRKYGARFLVRAGRKEQVEGGMRARLVVLEFKDYDTALACYRSPEYAHAMSLRQGAASADITVVEGYDGPQPGEG
ncbi:MAG: DUF1330 domain-containing protein [Geminicoccaceae bacterium]